LFMTTKTKIAIVAAAGIAVVTTPIVLQHQENARLREEFTALQQENTRFSSHQMTSENIKARASLQKEAETLRVRLQDSEKSNAQLRSELALLRSQNPGGTIQPQNAAASNKLEDRAEDDQNYVRVKRANLQSIRFDSLSDNFELTEQAMDLLEVTPEESKRLESILGELKQRVQTHDSQHSQEISANEVKDTDIARFLQGKEGQKTIYRIPPYSEEQRVEVREWFDRTVGEILDGERNDLFANNAKRSLDFWLGGTEDKIVAFVDRFDPQGRPLEHEWMIRFNTPSSHGIYSGKGKLAVPLQLRYLFEAVENRPPSAQ
jgi:hypothetical protein